MRIAAINIQDTQDGQLANYYVVANNYDFNSNNATDVTNFETLFLFYSNGRFDYGVFRDSLKANIVPNWSDLATETKTSCITYFCYPADITNDDYFGYVTHTQDEINWGNHLDSCMGKIPVGQRDTRLRIAEKYFTYRLTSSQIIPVALVVQPYLSKYTDFGLPYLICWITNTAYAPLGIDFTTTGFNTYSGYSDELRDGLINILVNGKY